MKRALLFLMATCSILWTYGQTNGFYAESALEKGAETVKKAQPAAQQLSAEEMASILIPNVQNANEPKGSRTIYLSQDFEAPFTGTPAAPAGWTQCSFVFIGTGTPSANGVDGEKDWQQNTWTGTAWQLPGYATGIKPTGAVSGTGVLYMEDSYFGSTASWLGRRRMESSVVNLATSTSPYVRFFYFYAAASSGLNIRVMASNDGGTTWNSIMIVHPNADVLSAMTAATPWQRINVLVPAAYRTANAKFGIEMTNAWGTNDIFIDDFSVEEFIPTTITSAATGNWSDATTWVGGVVPNANNHVVITAGHTVSTNVNIARCQNVTVDGTFQYGTTTTQFNHILGDLTVNSGGVYNSFSGTTGKRTMFGGSIINNGTINFSVGAGNLVWVGGAPATYSGTGSISSFVSNSWHANSGGVTYNAPVEIRNVMGLYIGAVNPNGNLTAGNILVTAQTVERTSIGYFTQAPIWTAGITRNVSYITANLSPTTKTTYSTGHDFPVVSGVGVLGGTLAMSTHDNVQLSVPVEVGTATTGVLTLTRGILITSDVNSLTLNSFIAGPAGTAPSILTPPTTHGSYVVGPLRINFPTTTFASRNFALGVGTDFNGTTPNSNILKTVTFASTVAWADVALRVRIAGAPSGTANSPLVSVMGTRAYQVERIGTADLPATATIAIRGNNYTFGNSDNLIGDRPEIRVAQANSLTGPWTERSLTTGTGAIVDNTTYTYTTAATAPGPIAPLATNGGFFAFATLYSAPLPAVFTFAPNQFPFSNVNIGSTSPDQTFTMSNTGGLPLSVTSVAKTGADAAEFVLTDANTYPLTLAAAASATYTVAFKPTSAGAKIASISMITSVGTYEVSLTGTGVEPPPTLPMPRNLTAIATPNTVQLNWQEPNLSGVTYEDFFEGFEAGILPTGWVIYDADGDTYNWEVFSIPASWPPHSGNGIIASASWMSTTGPLTPNNWLVTPPIQVSNESQLKFWVAGQDPAWAAEKYYVRISTTGNAVANFTTTLHTGISTGTWQEIVVNLSAYGGQTVYLAFVHADITDMFYIKLDDILVTNTVTTAAYTPFVANNNIPEYSFKTAGMTKAAINARLGQIYQSMVASQGLAAELDEGTGPVLVTPQGSKSLATRDVLYDNGPFINAPGQGPNGADGSVLQSSLGMTTYGPSVNYAATPVPIRVADDFEVTGNWNVETFTFYGYQTSTTHANPPLTSFTSGRLQIWDGDPANPASQVVWGDMTINRMVSTSWSGAYRYTETTVNNQRPIMAVVCETPGLTLQPGTYWVEFAMTGTIASGPWGVPITINGQTSTGNAQQYTGTTNAWAPLLMGGTSTPYGLPFLIGGTVGGGSDYNLLGYNVYRNGVQLANTISALTYLDTPVAAGTYTYGVTAVYGAPTPGESDPIEIDVTVSATAGIFPLLETFTNTLFPPEDWMVYDADGAGTIWVRSTAQNHTTGGGGSAFHNYAVASAGLQKGWLVSPLVSIPPAINAELTFWSYNSFPTDYGNNSVMVSTTTQSPATGNYVQVWTTASVTTAWVKTVVDLSSFAGQDIYFGFHYQGEYAHGWYLDDVSVDPRYPKDLAATKVTGPGNPTSGTASTYKVFVKNLGTAAQSTYTVSLFKEGGVLVGALPGVAIDPDQELSFDIPWTPGTAGNTFLYGVVDLAGDQLLANNTSPNLNVEVMPVGTVVVTIGTGTTFPTTAIRVPFDFYYKNNLAQSIYYADEIGPIGGFLKGITYYNSFVTNLPDKNVKIWVGTTTWDNLNAGWVAPASLTLMYDGTVNFPSGSNSIYIPFATPFVYMGGNLVVYTNRVWENFYFNSGDRFFLTQTTNKPARTRHVSADATVYDPATPPTPAASQLKDWHPNTTLFFQLAYGSVQGIVKDAASGNPILGAQVSMGNQSFVTLANGAFAFNDVSIGNYTLSAQKPGYATVTKQITIPANQTITEDLALTKDIVVPGAMIAVLNPSETSVVLKWGLPNGAYEIIYDDGVAETHAVWALGGNMNALRFTPASYPADILRGSVNIGNGLFPVGTVLTPFQMAVFDDDGPNGFPGTQLGVVSVTPTKYGWVNFNLSSLNLTIASGDFYLVMIQGGNSPNCVPIAVNQTNPVMRSYSRLVTGGGAWAIAGVNDFMIRAVVQSPGGMPGLALSPPYFVDYAKPQAGMLFEHNPISASGFVGEATYSPIEGTGEQFRNLLGYRIFRLSEGQENDEASWLMIGNPSNTVFVDNAWPTLPDGSYRWAVKARYTGGSFSGAVLSNILRKNFLSNVTVKVTLSDPAASPAGTKVTLTNNAFAQYNYAATAGANGTVNFPSVVKGAYTLNVLLDNYDPHTAQVNIIANTMTINVNLLETTYPPSNLVVNPITLVATWDQASPPFPEVIVNFNNGMPQGWTVISNGTAPDFKWQVIPDLGGSSLNGTPFAIANSDAAPSTALLDEYLISPVMNVASQPTVFLEFDQYYRHLGTGSYGQVDVWNGTAWITVLNQTATVGSWTAPDKRVLNLTAYKNAQFQVRFHYFDNSVWAWYWAIDNIKISRGTTSTRSVTSYKVYLDGTLKGTTTQTTFTYNPRELVYGQSYLAGVEAVYQSGVSARITHQFTAQYLFKPCNLQGSDIGHSVKLIWQAPGSCVTSEAEAVSFPFGQINPTQEPLPVLMVQPNKEVAEVKGGEMPYIPGSAKPLETTRAVLFNNGPLVTHAGTGPGGSDLSVLQSASLAMGTYGAGCQLTAGNSIADDFVVTGNWNVENIELFTYQTGSTTVSTSTGGYIKIYNGNPSTTGTVIWGDFTTNRMVSTSWINAYRVLETALTGTTRPIMKVVCATPGLVLPAGTYWVEFTLTGSLASGPWVPAVTILGQTTTGNAIQKTSTGWAPLVDVGPQGTPFIINGTAGSPPVACDGFNIYRGTQKIGTVAGDVLTYTDQPLVAGTYSYSVTALYLKNNVLVESPHEGPISVIVAPGPGFVQGVVYNNVTYLPIAGATVTAGTFSATSLANGTYALIAYEGPYNIKFSAVGYDDLVVPLTVVWNQTLTLNAGLTPRTPGITVNPTTLSVSLPTNQTTTRTVNVSNPGVGVLNYTTSVQFAGTGTVVLNEGFEGTVFPPTGWVKMNPDLGTGWTSLVVGTTPIPGWTGGTATAAPDGGTKMAFCTWTTGGAVSNDQWLVSPQVNVSANSILTFYARKFGAYLDRLQVKLSTTTQNSPAAFTIMVADIPYTAAATDEWVLHTYNLSGLVAPGTNVFIGFREVVANNVNDGAAIFVDNVKVVGQLGWLSVAPVSGSVAPGANINLTATFNTAGLTPGTYTATFRITSNAPTSPTNIPVNLVVTGVGVGIEDPIAGSVLLYPVPASDLLNIQMGDNIRSIRMINYLGQVMLEQDIKTAGTYTVDVKTYNSGAYIVQFITNDGQTFTKRIIVNK